MSQDARHLVEELSIIAFHVRMVATALLLIVAAACWPARAEPLREEVRIASETGVTLAGTLRIPTGQGSGPFPILLFLRGSGPSARGGVGPLADRLLEKGVAILEYDKRGVGQSTGQFVDTLENMETDATAAVAFLSSRRGIDPKRIAIAGHSQGGAVAPAVAAKNPAIAAVVMFAGPVAPPKAPKAGEEINLVIMEEMLAKGGADQAAIEQVSNASQLLFQAQFQGAPAAEIALLREAVIKGFIACKFSRAQAEGALATLSAIVMEAMNADFAKTLARVRPPVLALYGTRDEIVSPRENLTAARAALSKNPAAKVIEIADVDHGFRHVKDVSTFEETYAGPIAAPEVIALVTEWLGAILHRRAAA